MSVCSSSVMQAIRRISDSMSQPGKPAAAMCEAACLASQLLPYVPLWCRRRSEIRRLMDGAAVGRSVIYTAFVCTVYHRPRCFRTGRLNASSLLIKTSQCGSDATPPPAFYFEQVGGTKMRLMSLVGSRQRRLGVVHIALYIRQQPFVLHRSTRQPHVRVLGSDTAGCDCAMGRSVVSLQHRAPQLRWHRCRHLG